MSNTQAVIFDLYGTLLYLAKETKPYAKLFADLDLHSDSELKSARHIALTENFDRLADLAERIKPNGQFSSIDFISYQQEVEEERNLATVYPETRDVLEKLGDRKLKLGLISNLASPYCKPFFDLGLDIYFDEVLFSCDIGLTKPDPRIYQIMMDRLNINPGQALMNGDKVHADVDGPKAIGMRAVHLDRSRGSVNSISTLDGVFDYL